MLTGAYDLLVNFRNPHYTLHLQNQDSGLAFTQEDDDDWEQETMNPSVRCGGHGGC